MVSTRLLDYDGVAGIATYHHYDPGNDVTTIQVVQDVQPYLERNKIDRNANSIRNLARKSDIVRIGSIPVGVQLEWMKKYGIKNIYSKEYRKKILSLLRNPEYRYLTTATGKI